MREHSALTGMVALSVDLSAPILSAVVLCLISNILENWWSNFLALGFLESSDWSGDYRLLSVNSSGVETITDSILALN